MQKLGFFLLFCWGVLAAPGAVNRHPLFEPALPPAQNAAVQGGLQVAALPEFARVEWDKPPADTMPELQLKAWRGERVAGRVAAWSAGDEPQLSVRCSGLQNELGQSLPVQLGMLRYTAAHGQLYADVLGRETVCDASARRVRPVWVQVDVPQHAAPGHYHGVLEVWSAASAVQQVPVELEVLEPVLPAPADWKIHLDLWQHPQAVARWHGVEPWSAEHLALLKPLMKRLADAGQKAITCTIIDEAWNGQTYDWFPSLVRWVRGADGQMRYDFTAFDTWVDFMLNEVGIRGQISCYTMVPWSMKIRYYDEASRTDRDLKLDVRTPQYEEIWGHFLSCFRAHLQQRGWLEKCCIALDERPDAMMLAARAVVQKYAPELRIVSAVDKPSATTREVYDISPILTHADSVSPELLRERKAQGRKTTFYVCLHPLKPNTFTMSPPAEAAWLGLFAAANHLDGFLRWAYNSWNLNPFETTDFVQWPSGDCFLVYPGNLSSRRFEHLRDGFEDFEKVNLLRARAAELNTPEASALIGQLNQELAALFTVARSKGDAHEADVLRARELINDAAAALLK